MAQQGGGQSGDESSSMDILWGIVAVVAAALAIWYFGKNAIVSTVFTYKLWQLDIAKYVSPHAAALQPYLEYYRADPSQLSFESFQFYMTEVGKFLRYPFAAMLLGMAAYIFFGSSAGKFNKVFTMERMYNAEKKDWPQIVPISKVDLITEPIDKGPWAMALSPMEFAKKFGLLREIKETVSGTRVSERGTRLKVEVVKTKAAAVFASQIGREFESIEALPLHTKALFAAFLAKANQDRVGSKKLLDAISTSSETGKYDFTGTDELIKKHRNAKPLAKILARHAYVNTVMASMLEYARSDGVLASADFLWLKPVDRNLWYLLNSIGRQTPFAEVGGPFAHWLVEKDLNHRITTPMVEEAVNGLELAINDILYMVED